MKHREALDFRGFLRGLFHILGVFEELFLVSYCLLSGKRKNFLCHNSIRDIFLVFRTSERVLVPLENVKKFNIGGK